MAYAPMYEMWRVEEDGVTLDVLLDLGHGEDYPLRGKKWFFGVRLPMARSQDDGHPDVEEERRLNLVENRIREEVIRRREGVYVGRRTGGSNRDLVFYLPDRSRGLEDRLRASVGLELLFVSREDKSWAAYQSMLPGAREWRQIEDRKCIEALLEIDSNPDLVHHLLHAVETEIPKGAEALVKLFEKLELEDITVEGKAPSLRVSGVQRTPLMIMDILRVSWVLESRAPKARGAYAGWTAEPVYDGPEDDEEMTPEEEAQLKAILESVSQAGDG